MKLYNQTKNHLRWDISHTPYTCEPWGEVVVPDMFVEHCKARGLPLGTVPVAPEVKASTSLSDAAAAAKKDELIALEKAISEAKAAEKVAKDELEKVLAQNAGLVEKFRALEIDAAGFKSKFETLVADHAALTQLTSEQAKQLESESAARKRAEATIEELRRPTLENAKQDAKQSQSKR